MSDDARAKTTDGQSRDPISERVTDLSTSFIMTSGAGCGKTYRMVERYTAIIEAGVDVRRIIAVTFTEKAAAELRDRVRRRCREMAASKGLPQEERGRWRRAARGLALAPVTTIHGLCARLLRENAVAAGVDPQFEMLAETDQHLLLRDCVRQSLLDRLHEGLETARTVVAAWGLSGAEAEIGRLVGEREEVERFLNDPPDADTLLGLWETIVVPERRRLLEAVLGDRRWREAVDVLTTITPAPGDAAGDRQQKLLGLVMIAMDAEAGSEARISALRELFASVSRHKSGAQSKWKGRLDELERVHAAFCSLTDMKDEYREQVEALDNPEDRQTAQLAAAACAEASVAAAAYRDRKRERSALDFADLQILARDLLRDNEDVRKRVSARYEHVLVDEFQDTNALQKEIIWRIAGVDPGDDSPPPGRLFVVGDAKQSIYAFRNADVTVFNRTIEEFEEAEGCDVLTLEQSRRSHPSLVDFHNFVFSHEAVMGSATAEYEAQYEAVSAWREKLELPCDVELMLQPAAPGAGGEESDEDAGSLSAGQARMAEAEALAARIRQMVEGAELEVHDPDAGCTRPVEYGDIGVLFQSMSNVHIYEYALRRAEVPYYTVAGRGFYNRQEIRDCINLLRVLENAADELALVGALRSPMFALSDDAIYWLTREREPLWAAVQQAAEGQFARQAQLPDEQVERIRRARDVIAGLRSVKDRLALSELVERMLAETGLAAIHLTQFAGRQAAANLDKLTDLARGFEETGEFGLRQFTDYLSDLVTTEYHEALASVHEEDADVVSLLTVHRAKGLEWPVVVIPDMQWSRRGGGDGQMMLSVDTGPVPKVEDEEGNRKWGAVGETVRRQQKAREEAERRRLLYVALTRARDHLLLSSSYSVRKDGGVSGGPWLEWILEALGIHPDEVANGERVCPEMQWTCTITRAPEVGEAGVRRGALVPPGSIEVLRGALRDPAGELPEFVRPIEPGGMLAGRLSVTALRHFRECPRGFYLRHVERRPEEPRGAMWLERLSAAERGNVAHRALEIIGRGETPLDRALQIACSSAGVGTQLCGDDRDAIVGGLRWFVEEATLETGQPLYDTWIRPARRLRGEVGFAARIEGMLIEGQIDALVEGADGCWRILDYKTGRSPSEQRLDGYRFQIGVYCAALEAVRGLLPTDAALVLLEANQVLRVDPRQWAQTAREAIGEMQQALERGRFGAPEAGCPPHCALAYACELA